MCPSVTDKSRLREEKFYLPLEAVTTINMWTGQLKLLPKKTPLKPICGMGRKVQGERLPEHHV